MAIRLISKLIKNAILHNLILMENVRGMFSIVLKNLEYSLIHIWEMGKIGRISQVMK